jgi:hypothetical protein
VAIEWYISEALPVGQLEIIQSATEISERLAPGIFDLALAMESARRKKHIGDEGLFSDQIYGEGADFTAIVEIMAVPMLGSDEQAMEDGSIFGTVSARRTRSSAVLGLVVAIAWLQCLNRFYSQYDTGQLFELFTPSSRASGSLAVRELSQSLLGANALIPYS